MLIFPAIFMQPFIMEDAPLYFFAYQLYQNSFNTKVIFKKSFKYKNVAVHII